MQTGNLYFFGDTHGTLEIQKVFNVAFDFKAEDYVIVCGDFGVLWDYKAQGQYLDKKEKRIYKQIEKLPCTLLFVDGNHENFDRLNTLPVVQKFGAEVGEYVKDKCYHLRRGEIYNIAGKNALVCGGALSIDKEYRLFNESYTRKRSWWAGEDIKEWQIQKGCENIAKFNGNIDLVITHTCPQSFFSPMRNFIDIEHKIHDENSAKLEKLLNALIEKKQSPQWFFGHWHADFDFEFKRDESTIKAHCLYDEMFDLNAHTRELLNHAYRLAKQEQMLKYGENLS